VSVDVTVEQRIARPRHDVAAVAMDPANDRRWIGALTEVNKLTEGPVGPGTRVERVAAFLGRRMRYVNEIVAYDPPARLEMRSVEAPFPMRVTYELEEDGGSATLARIRAEGDAGRFYGLAGPLLSMMVRRGIRRDLRQLRELLEATGA
jgi:hypothetical protein